MVELNLNGYTDIPNGKVANVATFLEMTAKPPLRATCARNDLSLFEMRQPDVARYQAIFKAVGEDWLWFSRLTMSEETLAKTIATPEYEIFVMMCGKRDAGLLELHRLPDATVQLAYFGLAAEVTGTGAGRYLMNEAIKLAFDRYKAERLFVHTCTMDSPGALDFYLRSGFKPYKRAIEVSDDPRLSGHIPREKGSYHPIIEPDG